MALSVAERVRTRERARHLRTRATQRLRPFAGFIEQHNPSLLTYEHIPRLVNVMERVARGALLRVMIIEPPRYLKSEVVSRLFPAYYLRKHPGRHMVLASYGADLAWDLSEQARYYFMLDGGQVASTTGAKKHWKVKGTKDGGMLAAGVGGPILGHGYRCGLIDDPVDPEKALSPTYQRRFREWLPSKWFSRQDGEHAAIVIVMQRLGVEDPIDFLFRCEVGENTVQRVQNWHVVLCDEIKSEEPLGRWSGPMGLPPTCTLEPDDRKTGLVLAPSLLSETTVKKRQQEAGPYTAAAQRQGRPMRPSGDFWKKTWFEGRTYDVLPKGVYDGGKDWDTAYTAKETNAASAWIETYRGPGTLEDCAIYVHDLDWAWLEFPDLIDWMKSIRGPHYVEAKASGKSSVQTLKSYGVVAEEVAVNADKFMRATSAQPAVSAGRIYVHNAVLQNLLYGEGQGLLRITAEMLQHGVGGLDLNDVFVQALHRHLKLAEKPGKIKKRVRFA